MRLFSCAYTALVVVTAFLSSVSAFAATPVDIAFGPSSIDEFDRDIYRRPLNNTERGPFSERELRAGRITLEDVIRAAGKVPTPELRRDVSYFITHIYGDH